MSIEKVFQYFWDSNENRIKKLDLLNGSRFQKAHQEFINKHKPGHKTSKQIRKLIGELVAKLKKKRRII